MADTKLKWGELEPAADTKSWGGGGVAMQNNIFVIRFLQLIESVLD